MTKRLFRFAPNPMKIKLGTFVYSLAALPNRDGFPFVGVLKDGTGGVDCHVTRNPDTGAHSVAGGATYGDLIGWIRK